jgi:hypothetical protein
VVYGTFSPTSEPVSEPQLSLTAPSPATGSAGQLSGVFTVALPTGVVSTAIIRLTSQDNQGTFTPATVTLSAAAPSATFRYTPHLLALGPLAIGVIQVDSTSSDSRPAIPRVAQSNAVLYTVTAP